jgi:hydroxypyruvate isomerase
MYELSANVEWLFTEAGPRTADRIQAAADHGLPAVEIWTWRDKPLDEVANALARTGTQLQTMCAEPMGCLVDPDGHAEFLSGLADSIPVADDLGSPYLVVTAGDVRKGVTREAQHAAVIQALRRAVDALAGSNVVLLLENLNSRVDHVGTYLDSTTETIQIVREVASPQVCVLYDLYHSLMMDEDPAAVLHGASDLVGHVQIADTQGRIEPREGPLDWPGLLHTLRLFGYPGRLGLEFMPSQRTVDALVLIEKAAAAA